jgi:rare lipoprotein A
MRGSLCPDGTKRQSVIEKDQGLSLGKNEMRSHTASSPAGQGLALIGRYLGVSLLALTLANCASAPEKAKSGNKYGVKASPKVVQDGEPVPKGGGYDMVGKPYTVAGKLYVPKEVKGYSATGTASWYGPQFHGRLTANGEVFDRESVSIAHPTMPLPSYVRVTNTLNGRSIIARANDRGPYHDDRLVDVSEQVATSLGFKHLGTARVRVDYLGRAPMEGDDDGMLLATLSDNWRPAQLGRAFPQKTQVASTTAFAPQTPAQNAPATQAATPAKPLPAVALPSRPPAAPAKGVAAKILPGQKTAPARFVAQVPAKAGPVKTGLAKSTPVKTVTGKMPAPPPAQLAKAAPAKPQLTAMHPPVVNGKTAAAPQIKAPASKPVVAMAQVRKPAPSSAAPVKTQANKPAVKTPEKAKGKNDPHRPQNA